MSCSFVHLKKKYFVRIEITFNIIQYYMFNDLIQYSMITQKLKIFLLILFLTQTSYFQNQLITGIKFILIWKWRWKNVNVLASWQNWANVNARTSLVNVMNLNRLFQQQRQSWIKIIVAIIGSWCCCCNMRKRCCDRTNEWNGRTARCGFWKKLK